MSTTAIQKVIQPALINIGNRSLSTRGYRHDLLLEHLQAQLGKLDKDGNPLPISKQWVSIEELARVFKNRNTPTNCAAIRKSIAPAFRKFLNKGIFMLIEYASHTHGMHGKKLAVKLYRGDASGLELQHAKEQIDCMRREKELSEEKYRSAQLLLGFE